MEVVGPVGISILGVRFQVESLGSRVNYYFTEMCSGSEVGSYSRLMDFVYYSTLGLRVINKKKRSRGA